MTLLDILSAAHTSEIGKSFDQIADYLFHQTYIQVGTAQYQLTEIEFYYYDMEEHPDSYAHKNEVQLDLGNWYFHGSGLDITFGNKEKRIYGGILIRGIKNLDTGIHTSGPINTVRELMQNFKLVTEGQKMQLIEQDAKNNTQIIKTARIGLNPDRDPNYYNAPYRYLIDWEANIKGHRFKDKLKVRKQGILCTFVKH